MSSAFQNRLVGTVVVVAIAVIFLPDLLDGEKVQGNERFVSVPPRPQTQPITTSPAFPAEQVAQATTRKVEIVDAAAQDESLTATPQQQPVESVTDASNANESLANGTSQEDAEKLAELARLAEEQEAITSGWVIQLGVFRHQANVKQLLQQLEAANYRAFSRKIKTTSGELTKVFVGPDLNKQKLESAIPHLKEITGLQGKVSRFSVERNG